MAHRGGHAIVIGASMGGLLAARAVAEHYDRVTVIERDELPEAPEPRKPDRRTRCGRGCPRRCQRGCYLVQTRLLPVRRAERPTRARNDPPLAGERRAPPTAASA
jgi:pimeloyl-ACP methyl ester carboxylesterase